VAKLVDVCRVDQIPPNGGLTVRLQDFNVALFMVQGEILAVDGDCIRCASLLTRGIVDGAHVTCSTCGWRYDLRTGGLPGIPKLRLDTFAVEVVDSRVMVRNPFA
jgi:nitrite reductase/ring-hydroxylating ferredoxin subunit